MMGRECVKCGVWKPREEFHRHAKCKGGINTVCKECRKPISTAQYAKTTLEYRIWSRAKSRAKKKGLPFTITVDDIVIPDVCPVLGIPIDCPSIDQHRPAEGYTPENVVIMSNRANVLKNNGTLREFELLVKYLKQSTEERKCT